MKKTILLYSLLCCIFFKVKAQTFNCATLKNGVYEIQDAKAGTYQLIRNGDSQIEKSKDGQYEATYAINWTNKCTYSLQLVEIVKNNKNIDIPQNVLLTIKILEVHKGFYTQSVQSSQGKQIKKQKVLIIKP